MSLLGQKVLELTDGVLLVRHLDSPSGHEKLSSPCDFPSPPHELKCEIKELLMLQRLNA